MIGLLIDSLKYRLFFKTYPQTAQAIPDFFFCDSVTVNMN
jgi:hypothetical protein